MKQIALRLCVFGMVLCFPLVGYAAKELSPDKRVARVEKQIASMNGALKHLLKEVAKARQKNDIRRINCLLIKLNLVKGLLKASEKAKVVLMESSYSGDARTANAYGTKIESYHDSVTEIKKSMKECFGVKGVDEGATVVYIQPVGEAGEDVSKVVTAWDWDAAATGVAGYPVVPPGSPFR